MSEHLSHPSPEHARPKHETAAEHVPKAEHHKEHAEKQHEAITPEKLAALQQVAESKAISGAEHSTSENETPAPQVYPGMQQDIKNDAYANTMRSVRRHLKGRDRRFSKVVHRPGVDAVSEVAGKTVARPSGILGGGLFALLGSIVLLYASKHYGFTYNYGIFLLLFVGGFMVGMTLELLFRAVHRR